VLKLCGYAAARSASTSARRRATLEEALALLDEGAGGAASCPGKLEIAGETGVRSRSGSPSSRPRIWRRVADRRGAGARRGRGQGARRPAVVGRL